MAEVGCILGGGGFFFVKFGIRVSYLPFPEVLLLLTSIIDSDIRGFT